MQSSAFLAFNRMHKNNWLLPSWDVTQLDVIMRSPKKGNDIDSTRGPRVAKDPLHHSPQKGATKPRWRCEKGNGRGAWDPCWMEYI